MNAHEVNWLPWSEWMTVVGDGGLDAVGLGQSVVDQRGVTAAVDGPADDLAGVEVEHDAAVELALAGGMLGDVGEPQLVGRRGGEPALDEVLARRGVLEVLHPLASARAGP